jgi:hypothetical protein
LQRPLPDGVLEVVARGANEAEAACDAMLKHLMSEN